jgi:flavin reductase (DIM6/NTAB) family NADH-FMN oxidoreductase RutF
VPPPDGCVLIEDAAAWFDCTIDQQIRSGDPEARTLRRPYFLHK